MKEFIKFLKHIAFLGSILCIVTSACSDMNELADRFYQEGEIIYASKVDSVATHTGYKKIGIDIFINTGRIEKVRIYWNNYRDSTDVQAGNRKGILRTVLDNMVESAYIFQIVSIDSYGNKSLPVELSGEVVGDNFVSGLRNRNISSAVYTADDKVIVNWGNAPNYSTNCKLTYTNMENRTLTVDVPVSENTTVITGWKSGLSYYTQFVADENAMDTLRIDATNVAVWKEFSDKSAWSVHSYTGSQHGDMSPDKAIDGNPLSTWHTNASLNFPYYIVIDFGVALQIDGIVFQNRLDDPDGTNWPKQVKWETGNDLNTWETVLEFSEMTNTKDELWLPCTTSTSARYLKFNMYSGWNGQPYGYIGEMGIFQLK
jgi:hypothetical protein